MSDSADAQKVPGAAWIAIPPDEISWTEGPYGETSVVWGDANAGPYGSFNRLPAGTVIPPHTHSSDNQLIVIEGSIHSYRIDDDDVARSRSYPAGSFVYEVGDAPHVLAVDSAGPATVYITQSGPLDLTLVTQDDPGWE